MNPVRVFCDGSAVLEKYNPDRLGGSGVYMVYSDGSERFFRIGWKYTKTGRAELYSLIIALKHLENTPNDVEIVFDSQYVQLSVRDRIHEWKLRGWVGSAGVVKNKELWMEVDRLLMGLDNINFTYTWHKGHRTDYENPLTYGNCVADLLADYKTQEKYFEDEEI